MVPQGTHPAAILMISAPPLSVVLQQMKAHSEKAGTREVESVQISLTEPVAFWTRWLCVDACEACVENLTHCLERGAQLKFRSGVGLVGSASGRPNVGRAFHRSTLQLPIRGG